MSTQFYLRFGSGDPRVYSTLVPTFIAFYLPDGTPVTPPAITNMGSSVGLFTFTYNVTTSIAFLVDGGSSLSSSDRYISGALDPVQAVDVQVAALSAQTTTLTSNLGTSLFAQGVSLSASIGFQGQTLVAVGNSLSVLGSSLSVVGTSLSTLGASMNQGFLALGLSLSTQSVTLSALAGLLGDASSSFGSSILDPSTVFGYLKRGLEFWEGNAEFDKSNGQWDIYSRGSSTLLRTKTLTNDSSEATKT